MRPLPNALLALALMVSIGLPARAADRDEPLTVDAGQMKIDGKRRTRQLTGGVEITRGSLVLKAGEVEMREGPRGALATALGTAAQPATFRQKRVGPDEVIEGDARRIEYDAASETVRFIEAARVRVYRDGKLADQVSGDQITYDRQRDVVEVLGATGAVPGRVRAVVTPRAASDAASAPAGGAR
ncbi:lipopolysaccharide export system protein LptA [Sphaerotilus hippei]|uniref:Lipopolysaccharide export system protein LptA n=1 Tax=Sphaerotilus hippei TaxID=744406 RepID=A0A318HAD8_9BURK|nr:lipopolysaccharide transport periplasmic protein LptA [Sphaerotilus hippei]PXW99252.1 lipopolysaccharide export system protein LptA [Sphaerotilus hippei]